MSRTGQEAQVLEEKTSLLWQNVHDAANLGLKNKKSAIKSLTFHPVHIRAMAGSSWGLYTKVHGAVMPCKWWDALSAGFIGRNTSAEHPGALSGRESQVTQPSCQSHLSTAPRCSSQSTKALYLSPGQHSQESIWCPVWQSRSEVRWVWLSALVSSPRGPGEGRVRTPGAAAPSDMAMAAAGQIWEQAAPLLQEGSAASALLGGNAHLPQDLPKWWGSPSWHLLQRWTGTCFWVTTANVDFQSYQKQLIYTVHPFWEVWVWCKGQSSAGILRADLLVF